MSRDILNAKLRTSTGSNAVKKLKNINQIPGVLYGHHINNLNLQINKPDFEQFIKKHNVGASLDLNIDGEKTFVILKDMQTNVLTYEAIHVEFQALSIGETIKMKIPIHLIGKENIPAGVTIQEMHHEVELNVLPKDLIEQITLDVSNVKPGDTCQLSDLDIANNSAYDILELMDTVIYTVSETKIVVDIDEEEVEESIVIE